MNRLTLAIATFGAAATPAFAQADAPAPAAAAPDQGAGADEEIVVTGGRIQGSVIGDIPPETTLNAGDIRSFGVSSVAELLSELSPQTGSNQGRGGEAPVVLLNGRRISSFAEIRDVPTEAIQRVEILPEEVALKYGYRPNQKVVNVVLRRRFRAFTGELEAGAPTDGGQFSPEAEGSYLRIQDGTRMNLAANYQRSSALFENERDVVSRSANQPIAGIDPNDLGRFRTLLPETETLTLNSVLARNIFDNISASLNGTLTYNGTRSAQGVDISRLTLPPTSPFYLADPRALEQDSRDLTGHLGATFNGALGTWNWTLTGNYDHVDSRTDTDRGAIPTTLLVDRARSNSDVASGEMVFTGSFVRLPAGAISTTLRLGGAMRDLASQSTRSGLVSRADLSRDQGNAQISLDLPIASTRENVLAALGTLTANVNAGYDRLSDFGGLVTYGAGLNWTPFRPLSLIVSWNREEGAPTIQQLGNPLVSTTNVRVFDFVRGETVDITRLTGGNPDLDADRRGVFKLGLTLKPLTGSDLSITTNYTKAHVRDPIASFPTATAAIEAAFPGRFVRDAAGRLLQIDSRPINFAAQDSEDIRYGINFSKQLSTPPRPAAGQGGQPSLRDALPPGQGQPPGGPGQAGGRPGGGPGGFGRGPGGFGGPGGPGGRGTRLQLAIYHTIHLKETIRVNDGGPVLDLLDGDAITSSGGQSRHEVQAQAGLTHNGLGARLTADWRSSTRVNGGLVATEGLRFSDLTTVSLRLFANLGQQEALVRRWSFLRGSRLSLSVNNLFNDRLDVRDTGGTVPVNFQPAFLDPLGRSVRLSFRKLFFSPPRPVTTPAR